MKLRKDLLQGIERFLALVSVQTRQRGRDYFAAGQVLELKCVEPDYLYAAVVRGGADYEVGLEFADRVWVSKCSCPMHYDCKHTVAAMLDLQRRALPAAPPPEAPDSRLPAQSPEPERLLRTGPPLLPSPLYQRLLHHLRRGLSPAEAEFIRNVQLLYLKPSGLGQHLHKRRTPGGRNVIRRNDGGHRPLRLHRTKTAVGSGTG